MGIERNGARTRRSNPPQGRIRGPIPVFFFFAPLFLCAFSFFPCRGNWSHQVDVSFDPDANL
jgi:hypothetical protein